MEPQDHHAAQIQTYLSAQRALCASGMAREEPHAPQEAQATQEARAVQEALRSLQNHWKSCLAHPNWYEHLEAALAAWIFPIEHDDQAILALRDAFYQVVEALLAAHQIPLAQTGPDFDAERRARSEPKIDTIVLHHTEESNNSLPRLNALGLVRQYAQAHLEPAILGHPRRGQPIWSGHFDAQGQMVFYAYHWLIEPDGTPRRLLSDTAIGWHAGNWAINVQSAGIALAGNYEHATPPQAQLEGTATIIKTQYPQVPRECIFGHREIRSDLTCPGAHFLGETGWKSALLHLLSAEPA